MSKVRTVDFFRRSGNLATSSAMKWALYDQSPRKTPTSGYLLIGRLDVRLGPGVVGPVLEDLDLRECAPCPGEEALPALPGVGGGGRTDEHRNFSSSRP